MMNHDDAVEVGNLISLGEGWYYDNVLNVSFTLDANGNAVDKYGNILHEVER